MASNTAKNKRKIYAEFKAMSEILSFLDYLNILPIFFSTSVFGTCRKRKYLAMKYACLCTTILPQV